MKLIKTFTDLKKFINIDLKFDEALGAEVFNPKDCEAAIRYTVKTYNIPDNVYVKWLIRTHGGMFIGYEYTMYPKDYNESISFFNNFKEFKRRNLKSWKK